MKTCNIVNLMKLGKTGLYIQNEVYFMKEDLEESEKGTREKQDSGRRGNN